MMSLNKTIDRLNSLDKQKLILLILICAVAIYIDFAFIIRAQLKGIKSTGQKITKLSKDINTLSQDLVIMQKAQAEQSKKSASKAKTIISEQDLSSLLESISNIANKTNVRIMQIKPNRDLKDKDNKPTGAANTTPFLITLDLLCGYHNLGRFINDIENSDILMAVEELKISASLKDPIQQNANLVIRTYVQK